jgi:hypothetical protein
VPNAFKKTDLAPGESYKITRRDKAFMKTQNASSPPPKNKKRIEGILRGRGFAERSLCWEHIWGGVACVLVL